MTDHEQGRNIGDEIRAMHRCDPWMVGVGAALELTALIIMATAAHAGDTVLCGVAFALLLTAMGPLFWGIGGYLYRDAEEQTADRSDATRHRGRGTE